MSCIEFEPGADIVEIAAGRAAGRHLVDAVRELGQALFEHPVGRLGSRLAVVPQRAGELFLDRFEHAPGEFGLAVLALLEACGQALDQGLKVGAAQDIPVRGLDEAMQRGDPLAEDIIDAVGDPLAVPDAVQPRRDLAKAVLDRIERACRLRARRT